MKLAAFTDEISPDPSRAIALAVAWQIPFVEVRNLSGRRFPQLSDAELEGFHRQVVDAGLGISGVSPGFCKCPVDDPAVADMLAAGLPRACEWAQRWGVELVSCFGFQRHHCGTVPGAVLERLAQMAEIAARHDCRLVLENEAGCWGDTGIEAASIIRQVAAGNLSLLWDPGNAARAGSTCPYPDEYRRLKDLVSHVHLKNFAPETGGWSLMEQGLVDWPGQLAALERDGYRGFVVIETHLHEPVESAAPYPAELTALEHNSRRNLDFLRSHWTE